MLSVSADNENAIVAEVDSDVAAEKKRIHTADIDALKTNNVLVAKYVALFDNSLQVVYEQLLP